MKTDKTDITPTAIALRQPVSRDARGVERLIQSCQSLDDNSLYCNLLQCDHFAQTCVVAKRQRDGAIMGWISAYVPPEEPEVLFVWQVAVHPEARGQGLAKKMLRAIVDRKSCADIRQIRATITSDNEASWALFSSFARERARGGTLERRPYYSNDEHFGGSHPTEHLVTLNLAKRLSIAA